ncbi:MAG: hypothetical protein ACRETZ_03235 [Steroidobacteraceae bacterium]
MARASEPPALTAAGQAGGQRYSQRDSKHEAAGLADPGIRMGAHLALIPAGGKSAPGIFVSTFVGTVIMLWFMG